MHHHLFSTEDTFITNLVGYEHKNFGVDPTLGVGTHLKTVQTKELTTTYYYQNVSWSFGGSTGNNTTSSVSSSIDFVTNIINGNTGAIDGRDAGFVCFENFTGTVTGSFIGNATTANGLIVGSASFTSSYFSGSIDGGTITIYSSSVTGYIVGTITGSLTSASIYGFLGSLSGSAGSISGVITGIDIREDPHWVSKEIKKIDRTLLRFNLDTISASISNGEITSPQFKLNLKVCNEYQLPIQYTIYAFPISQSWNMGNGSFVEGGSDLGVSWYYRDYASGSAWATPLTASVRPVVDFINTSSNSTGSFNYGGGTWYTSVRATQSFNYESSDISMDVTPIIQAWLSGSIPNNGFILISSDEIVATGSGYTLSFYGRDTNTIYSPYLDVMWEDWSWRTGSVGTSSVTITSSIGGATTTVQTGSSFTITGGITGSFSSSIFFTTTSPLDAINDYFEAIIIGTGLTGNIIGMPIVGPISGSITIYTQSVMGPCGNVFDAKIISASFSGGIFSGSGFTGFFVDNKIENGILTGSWPAAAIVGAKVSIPLPSGIDPYAYAYVTGPYVHGKAFGTYQISGSIAGGVGSESASFNGVFIEGPLIGGNLNLQLSGSVTTSSYAYTSSVEISSSILSQVDLSSSFIAYITNLKPHYRAGDLVKISVRGRKEFPLKRFGKTSQPFGYFVPEILPSSSYYAIKDNLSEEIIINFDNYTRISSDYPHGNYFMLDTTGLAQERPYRILIQVVDGYSKYTFDNGDVFKITK